MSACSRLCVITKMSALGRETINTATAEGLSTRPRPRDYRHGQSQQTIDTATAEGLSTRSGPRDYRHGHSQGTIETATAKGLSTRPRPRDYRHGHGSDARSKVRRRFAASVAANVFLASEMTMRLRYVHIIVVVDQLGIVLSLLTSTHFYTFDSMHAHAYAFEV